MTDRHCACCGDSMTGPAHKKYCAKSRCQTTRKALAAQRRKNLERPERQAVCIICGEIFNLEPYSKPGRKVCYKPECRLEQRRRAGKNNVVNIRARAKEVTCLKCGRKFKTELIGKPRVPQFRRCANCRKYANDEGRFFEAWG